MAGTHYDIPAIPFVEKNTQYFEAGDVTFAIETRELNQDALDAGFADDPEAHAIATQFRAEHLSHVVDGFVSIHVLGPDGAEYLRFDDVRGEPHYHYCWGRERHQVVVEFDPVADGDFVDWVFARLRTRLLPLLLAAKAPVTGDPALHERFTDALAEAEAATRAGAALLIAG